MTTLTDNAFFLPYQSAWITDQSRIKIMEKSRQIGMSLATAYGAVRAHTVKTCNYDTWVASRDEIQAKLFIDDCKKFAKILSPACDFFGNRMLAEHKAYNSSSLKFSNDTAIHSLTSSTDAQAGKRGTRILDEFALHNDPKQLYTIALPGITWGGQLAILSTHRGSNNFFNKLIDDILYNGNPKNISHHKTTLQDALDQGFLEKLQTRLPENDPRRHMSQSEYFDNIKNSCPDEESFLQEYMCIPSDDRSAFLSSDLIAKCEYDTNTDWERTISEMQQSSNSFFLGIDVGRNNDLTVFWILELINDILMTRKIICLQNTRFSEQEDRLHDFLNIKNLRRICIDQTGIGRQFAERAEEYFGHYRVEGITFSHAVKEQLAYPLRTLFEDNKIKIPDDDIIRADLHSVRRETTFAGNIRFAGDRTRNGHADRFWALALAVHAAGINKEIPCQHFETIERKSNRKMPQFL